MDIKAIEELAKLMKENGLTALEVTEGESTVKMERKKEIAAALAAALPEAPARAASPFVPAAADGTEVPAVSQKGGTLVTSPTVGVFYSAPSPESDPFVKVGDRVKKGDVLCIIEAMKLMNEIPAEVDGTVAEVCVSSGQLVEYNQPLFRII